jgi:hypothetical protein
MLAAGRLREAGDGAIETTLEIARYLRPQYNRGMKLDRGAVRVIRGEAGKLDETSLHTPGELLSFAWQLTAEVYSLRPDCDVNAPMRRDVVRVIRKNLSDSEPK